MEMPKPTDAHRTLAKLVGSWKGEEVMHPSPWDPKGGKSTGWVENRSSLGGFVVLHDYRQERDGKVEFEGLGVFWWDREKKSYALHWFDSMGTAPNEFRGHFEGDVLTMTSPNPIAGQSRASFDFSEPGKYSFEMAVSQDGERWIPMMEGVYEKTS